MAEKLDRPIGLTAKPTRSQEFYDSVKQKYAEERDLRLKYRPKGPSQYTSELTGSAGEVRSRPLRGASRPASRSTIPSNACSSAAASRRS